MDTLRHSKRQWPPIAALVAGLILGVPQTFAETGPSLEYQVKAAFLFNFTKFIEWPPQSFPDATTPISICVLGNDPFGTTLDHMVSSEPVKDRKVVIQRIQAEQAKSCQILFVADQGPDVPALLAGLSPGVLTVGEGDRFLREGGVIAFVIENRRVRFDINQSAAGKASLMISSKLLRVARSVER